MTKPMSTSADTPSSVKIPIPVRFFVIAMMSFAGLAVLAPKAFPLLVGSFYDRGLLAFVHLNTLGIIAAAIVGASYQVVPCALGVSLDAGRAIRASFWLHLSGLVVFLIGFFQTWHPVLATGGLLLVAGLTLYVVTVGRALRRSETRDVVYWHIGVSLVSLVVGLSLGFLLAGSKGTWFLGGKTMQILAAHAVLMLAGWVAVMLNGVAYHMVPMLSSSTRAPWRRIAAVELALVSGGAWLASIGLLFALGRPWVAVGAVAIVAGEALFFVQIARLYLTPERWRFVRHMPFLLLSAAAGLAASLVLAYGLLIDESLTSGYWVAAGWLAIGGMALTAIQGLFQTIAAELTGTPGAINPRMEAALSMVGWAAWAVALGLSMIAIFGANAGLAGVAGIFGSFGLACFLVLVGSSALRWNVAPFSLFRGVALRLAGPRS